MSFSGVILLTALLQNVAPPPPPVRVLDPTYEAARGARGGLLPPTTPPEPATVDGVVLESANGRPLPGATVLLQVRTGASLVTTTRPDGTFFFRNVPPGIYSIQAERGGYVPEISGTNPYPIGPAQQLVPGQKLSGVRLAMTRGSVISGRLIDDRGDVVVGALVQALKTTYKDGLPEWKSVQSAVSDDLGEYRLFMLRPGEYHISVNPPTLIPASISERPTVVPLYFPGTIDPRAAQAIPLHEGEAVDGATLSAIPTRTRRVTGSVQGNGGNGVGVVLSPVNSTTALTQTLNASDPVFQFFDVVPGGYMLVARTSSVRSAIPFDVRNADMLNMRISLGNGFRIPAHFHIEGHAAGDDPELEKIYFVMRPETAVPGLEGETYSPFPNGRLTLDLLAGDHRIDITQPEGAYVKSAMLGGVDVLNQGLHVVGSTDETVEVLIASDSGSLDGRADVRGAARHVNVVLVPDAARRGQRALFKFMKAGTGGEFHFERVPPGDYKLFAWAEENAENGGPWLDPEYLRKYEDRATSIHIDANRKTTANTPIPIF